MTKIALVIHGNMRTFFMKMREHNFRVCDMFMENIVLPNNPDIFITTDTDDFYYNNAQYFCSDKINIMNGDTFRLFNVVDSMSPDDAKSIISNELNSFFGNLIKSLMINNYQEQDILEDPIYKLIEDKTGFGYCPASLVGQYKKIYGCAKSLQQHEKNNNFKYDLIIKCRFDNAYVRGQKLIVSNYNYSNTDVYVPTYKEPLVHDWYAFGKRNAMLDYINLYESLGFTLDNPTSMIECRYDGNIVYFGNDPTSHNKDKCKICGKNDRLEIGNITLSSEHHIYAMFKKHGIRCEGAGYHTYVYRYRDTSCQIPLDSAIKNELKLKDITIVNHTPQHKMSSMKY